MNRVLGSTLLLAGTAIGAGMLGLPLVLAKVGLIPATIILMITWCSVYYSALASATLALRSGQAVSIGTLAGLLGENKSRKVILERICQGGMLLMTYALMVAYLSGGASILQNLAGGESVITTGTALNGFALFLLFVLVLGTHCIASINRLLFYGLIGALSIIIVGIGGHLTGEGLPHFGDHLDQFSTWTLLLPILFASFGFQLTIPSVISYLNLDAKAIRKSIFWGSLIPVGVYGLWIFVTLSIIHQSDPAAYSQMTHEGHDVGTFIAEISRVTQWPGLHSLSWIVSILAIITSAIGVGLGIKSFWKEKITTSPVAAKLLGSPRFGALMMGLTVVGIPYCISLFLKDAFMQSLAFAGMILVTLALLIPLYLLYKSDYLESKPIYEIIGNQPLRIVMFLFGVIILLSEILNIFVL